MNRFIKKEAIFLLLGDFFFLSFALWITLFIRYLEIPSVYLFNQHIVPFSFLFCVWIIVLYIAGLYEKQALASTAKLSSVIFNAQFANSAISVSFFYLIPYFGITPRVNLFIYLVVSLVLVLVWRIYCRTLLLKRRKEPTLLIGSGEEITDLQREISTHGAYGLTFVSVLDLNKNLEIDFDVLSHLIKKEKISNIVLDFKNPRVEPVLEHLYRLIFSNVQFIDMYTLYEEIFQRIPLSLIRQNWFLENISFAPKLSYDFLKRSMDIILSLLLGILSFVLYPILFVVIKIEDQGPLFFVQERVGKNNAVVRIIKFRTMTIREDVPNDKRITRVGGILRRTRIDELPQLWNVFVGDLSLIGPRPELPNLVKLYQDRIPYYNTRHYIKPGLSGWAQLYHKNPPKFDVQYEETRGKLSYDLYYIKNRSFLLDIKIALRTLWTLLSRSGV